jgi:hypothetical protein
MDLSRMKYHTQGQGEEAHGKKASKIGGVSQTCKECNKRTWTWSEFVSIV